MNTVTIHQPEHLPYLGFFAKCARADTVVFLDNVDFEKNYFQNRNRIYGQQGYQWITVPVVSGKAKIQDVEIAREFHDSVKRKNLEKIRQAYSKAPYFRTYFPDFEKLYGYKYTHLVDLNCSLLAHLFRLLEFRCRMVYASRLSVWGSKTDLLANICEKTNADQYLSGISGKDYLEVDEFSVPVVFQEFKHPVYYQYGKQHFLPNMSILDPLFNIGINGIKDLIKEL